MSKYKISAVKSLSPLKRYEHIRETGYHIPGADGEHLCLTGQELDDYLDEAIWRKKHPGQEPIKEWDDVCGEAGHDEGRCGNKGCP